MTAIRKPLEGRCLSACDFMVLRMLVTCFRLGLCRLVSGENVPQRSSAGFVLYAESAVFDEEVFLSGDGFGFHEQHLLTVIIKSPLHCHGAAKTPDFWQLQCRPRVSVCALVFDRQTVSTNQPPP